jgi:hypothetical protein
MIVLIYLIVLSSYLLIFFPADVIIALSVEGGLIENLGAISFVMASALFLTAYAYSSGQGNHLAGLQTYRNVFYLMLGILCVICFGEEVSWGQRLFNWTTPEWFKQFNVQGETNLHNISFFHGRRADGSPKSVAAMLVNMNRLFAIFWLTFCVVVPVISRFSSKAIAWFERVGLPITPGWIGGLFLTHALVFQVVYEFLGNSDPGIRSSINELKETNYAFIIMILAYCEFRIMRAAGTDNSAGA